MNNIFRVFRNKLNNLSKKVIIKSLSEESNSIPKYELQSENIKNTKILLNRYELLKKLPKNSIVAEIGVDKGHFSENILQICKPMKLHLIDSWDSDRYNKSSKEQLEEKFGELISNDRLTIHTGLSYELSNDFEDNYFDWIYIDTDHSYGTTINELEKYKKKIKKDGIIAGHDYVIGNWNGLVRYGVIEAVHEFCIKYHWEIIYLTIEIDHYTSFAIKPLQT